MLRPLLFAALCLATACAPARSAALVELTVIDRDNGQWLPDVHHRGERWIAGTPGHRYGVRVTNTSGQRVLVVLSVDGVNAVTGDTAHPSQAGYVLSPWQSSEIAGWRKSEQDVAQFVFTDLPDSYAARTGRPDDVGVIGIAVFTEARRQVYDMTSPSIAKGSAANSRAAAPTAESASSDAVAAQTLGTGHGQREWSPVSRTEFARASRQPAQISQLRYDDLDTLVARGVLPRTPRDRGRQDGPRAFPNGFVADPPTRW